MAKPGQVTNKSFAEQIEALTEEIRLSIESEVTGFKTSVKDTEERKQKAHKDFGYFFTTYFPHYATHEASIAQSELIEELQFVADSPDGESSVNAEPRGEGKSTIGSMAFVIWCVLTDRKKFPIIVMDTYEQAALQLAGIKVEFEENPRLRMDYGKACRPGRVWRENVILTPKNAKIQALGAGQKVRGRKHGKHRPDLFILDDLENDENVVSPEQRNKLERWVDRAVMQAGEPDGSSDVIYFGTVLHYDAVLNRKLNNPMWRSKRHQSIICWPDDTSLWDEWEELYRNEGQKLAKSFYLRNKKAMEKGAVVSWPAARPLYQLMFIRARDGHESFDAEHQNDPVSLGSRTFPTIVFWVNEISDWIYLGACDPSLGKTGKGRDPSAILVGGWDRLNGVLDVVEASIIKRVPSLIIADIIKYQKIYDCARWGFEVVQFQEYMRQQLIAESIKACAPVAASPITQSTDKNLRIEGIEPFVSNGNIRIHPRLKTLDSQMKHHPKADHDDGPDALEMLWRVATTMNSLSDGGIATTPRRGGVRYAGHADYSGNY